MERKRNHLCEEHEPLALEFQDEPDTEQDLHFSKEIYTVIN